VLRTTSTTACNLRPILDTFYSPLPLALGTLVQARLRAHLDPPPPSAWPGHRCLATIPHVGCTQAHLRLTLRYFVRSLVRPRLPRLPSAPTFVHTTNDHSGQC
ncbi:hypothetical protein FRC12_022278, partial [Ceratobasidium sp. 428]